MSFIIILMFFTGYGLGYYAGWRKGTHDQWKSDIEHLNKW